MIPIFSEKTRENYIKFMLTLANLGAMVMATLMGIAILGVVANGLAWIWQVLFG